MKNILVFMLVFVMLVSVCACNTEEKVIESALELIESGDSKGAYALLYENRDYESAKEMLGDFTVVYSQAFTKNYSMYNAFHQTDYNEYGDIISQIDDYEINNYDIYQKYTYVYTYGNDGRMQTCVVYDNDESEPYETTNYTYDDRGNLLTEETTRAFDGDSYTESVEYKYDSQGNMISLVCISDGAVQYSYTYAYDEKGNKIQENRSGDGEEYSHQTEYTYDENGVLIKESQTDTDGTITTEHTRNEHGDAVKTVTTYEYNEYANTEHKAIVQEYTYEYAYDQNGNKTKYTEHRPNGDTSYEEYVYNSHGDVIKKTSHDVDGGIRTRETEYEYNEKGDIIKETVIANTWKESTYKAEYDEHGNMTSETSGISENSYKYTYNDQGLMIAKTANLRDGSVVNYEYTYDENKNLTKEVNYRGDNSADAVITEYSYDESGKLIIKKTNEDGFDDTIEYTYNEHGDLISEHSIAYGANVPVASYEYVYGDNGNVISKTVFDKDGNEERTYTYDENGREISVAYYGSDGKEGLWRDYEYDDNGNLTKTTVTGIEDGEKAVRHTEIYTYDELGNNLTMLREGYDYNGIYATFTEYSEYLYFYTPNAPSVK